MQDSKIRSRLKAQLTRFTCELTAGLSKPLRNFVGEMLFGIRPAGPEAEQHRAQSARTDSAAENRRSSLAQSASRRIGNASAPGAVAFRQRRVENNTVLCLDLGDVRKEYARKMEFLDQVWDGSAGEVHAGYWLCSVIGAEVHGSELTPLYQQLFSVRAQDFLSENDELLSAIDQLRAHTQGRGIWTMDRGGDRRKLLEPLLERRERFVIRSTGQRMVLDRQRHRVTLHHLGACCRLRYQAKIIKIENGQEKIYQLRFGAEPCHLPGREEPLLLVVVAGFGQEPLLLLTNVGRVRDSQSLWWIAQIYLTRWKIEETFRFVKQSYRLEDIRVRRYQRLKNLVLLMTAAACFATAFLGPKLKLKILCEKLLIISQRFFGIPPFRFYALADGIRHVLSRCSPDPPPAPPQTSQLQLLLAWET